MSNELFALPQAPSAANQIPSLLMADREALKIEAAAIDPLSAAEGVGEFLSTMFVVTAVGAVVFGLLTSNSGEPLLLTLLSALAMLGVFLLFGVLAGHIRIGARLQDGDVLKAAYDTADEPIVVTGRNGSVIYSNSAHEAMFGRSDSGALAALEAALGGDANASQSLFRLMRAAERGETRREDIQLKPVAQFPHRPAWLSVTVRSFPSPVREGANSKRREPLVLWRFTDITGERNREAQRIGALEASLAAFETMPAGFIAVAAGGTISHINATFESWLGLPAGLSHARGGKLADLAGEDGAKLLAELSLEADPDHRTVDLDLSREDGRIVPLSLYSEASGQPGAFTVTAINRAMKGLAGRAVGSDATFADFFQSAPFGIATLDGDGRIANANAAFRRMLLDGKSAAGATALSLLARHADAQDRMSVETGLANVLSGRGDVAPLEISGGADKQQFHRVYMSPLPGVGNGEAAALYVIDATEQKALEARYAQAQKMEAVGKLAGGIAHDFNNVLTAIIGFSDLLLQTHRPSDPAYKDIKNIQSAANRAAGLVANLLGFSRKQTQQVAVLNLAEVAAEMAPILKTAVGEKIELKINAERDLWYVRADNNQIFNVILNLVRNARDAMPAGGKLTIRTRNVAERESQKMSGVAGFTTGEYVLIEVQDTGTGMNPEVMAKIFEPFFTTKGVGKGTGLGLASVYGIVKQSGGFILPESEIGKGTTFKIYLPRYVTEDDDSVEAVAKVQPKKAKAPVDLTGTGCVLLVEDEVEVRQFAVRALKRQGYTVLEAADGVEALEIMKNNEGKVDIVVSDVVMPEMDGPTLFKELKSRNPSIKVIFVSGYPNEAFRESLGSEDFAFLPKPFSLPQLAEKVKEELAK
jgi:two-component system cell cycle sensor histidine kinase/response regulator CckA